MPVIQRNTEGLKKAALDKKERAFERTEEALRQLIKEGKPISFASVAEAANVTRAWLYKNETIRVRIEELRHQCQPKKKVPPNLKPSESSKDTIIATLRERIKKLDTEVHNLRKQNEVLLGRLNLNMDLELENNKFKERIKQLEEQNKKLVYELNQKSNILPLNISKDTKKSVGKGITIRIKSELDKLGVNINSTLSKTIKSAASEEIVLFAIQALSEAVERGNVENPGGWLNAAIKDGWMPGENHLPGQKTERDIFKQWFDLAYKQRLVLAATKGDDEQMYVYTFNGESMPFKQMLSDYPIEKLKQ
ncbi:MAG TPA: DUF6262 family protein [Leptolyngbyaceae cyanobacterium]